MRLLPGCLALLLVTTARAGSSLRLEGGPFLPYRLNRAEVVLEAGLAGRVELVGRRWDGGEVPLCLARSEVRSRTLELLFYLDEDIRALELRCPPEGSVVLDLAREEGRTGTLGPEEAALRARMRAFTPPVHLGASGSPPDRWVLEDANLFVAGFQASGTLFRTPASWRPLALLGGGVLVAVAAAVSGRRSVRALRMGVAAAVAVTVAQVAVPSPILFRVMFPGDGPEARISGVLERRSETRSGYAALTYGAGPDAGDALAREAAVELVGLWAPAGSGIPVADLVRPGELVRFSSPPLVTLTPDGARLGAGTFVTGWVIRGAR